MTRLAVIAPQFPEYTIRYAQAMARSWDVLVCVDEAQMAAEYAGRDVPRPGGRLPATNRFKTVRDLFKLLVTVARHRPSIVHFQEAVGLRRSFFNACLATLMRPRARIVLTVHDPFPHVGRDASVALRTAILRDYVRRRADTVISHGDYCAAECRTFASAGTQQVVVSEHGLILEPPDPSPPPVSSALSLYFFGRMEAYKGVEVLLAAAETLNEEGVDFELKIAGRGPELDKLQDRFRKLRQVSLSNGFVAPTDIISSIQAAHCVVLPYLSATQSGVLAAAFAGRRFVVASRTGGLVDLVEHGSNGLLVPPGDPAALADAIRALARDAGLRARLQQGACDTADGKLNWDRIAADLQQNLSQAAPFTRLKRTLHAKV